MSQVELKGLTGLRDLDSLLVDSKTVNLSKENIFNIEIDSLTSGKFQPRTIIDGESLRDLSDSIKSEGILLPLIVRKLAFEKFEIIAGERRWRAARLAGLLTVPAIIRDIPDDTALAFALIENIQRESLNSIDEAAAFVRLQDQFGMTHVEIAGRVGRSRSAVTNMIRLLTLDNSIQELLRLGKIEMGHARALLSVDKSIQYSIVQKIISSGLSVRETEKMIQYTKNQYFKHPFTQHEFQKKIPEWEKLLTEKLSSSVKISLNAEGSGKVVIQIESPQEIEALIEKVK